MSGRSQCTHCSTALASGAKYCSECGAPQTLVVLDLLGVEDPPPITGTDVPPHARLRIVVGMLLVAGMLVVLWGVTRQVDPANEEPLSSETPDVGIGGTDATTSTKVATTTAPATTRPPPPTTSKRLFVNDVQGPVLGDGVDCVVVSINFRAMQQIDLSTGVIERIDLEYRSVYSGGPESGIVVNGNL